jgi:ABC-type multidrug transport system ATPase subunit/signal transduction histidine kinase
MIGDASADRGARRPDPVVRARNLSVRYGPVRALEHVDFRIHTGEIVALAGENGAGKSTLVRCLAGDISPDNGNITVHGQPLRADPRSAARLGVAVVWQDLALCDNLDIASNLLLGRESHRLMLSATRFQRRAAALLERLGIDLPAPGTLVANLSGGQRQLVAVARAMRDHPSLVILDEPTASLGVAESAQVEELTASLPAQGTAVMIVSHDLDQIFRLADRIVVLRRGEVVAEVVPGESHPDEVAALLSGQPVDVSARRQLSRLHSLSDQLASAEPSSSLTLIMSALGAALGSDQLCFHVSDGRTLRLGGSIGLPRPLASAWTELTKGAAGGQIGRAAATGEAVISSDVRTSRGWARYRVEARVAGIKSSWSVPFTGPRGDAGVITVLSGAAGEPSRDDLDLAGLYAGYAASALERDRLMGELTSRNMVLETIREVLETVAGPVPLETGLVVALRALQAGLGASAVGLVSRDDGDGVTRVREWVGPGPAPDEPPAELIGLAEAALARARSDTRRVNGAARAGQHDVCVTFSTAGGKAALLARLRGGATALDRDALIDDAAHSLRLALEREESERAQREAMALRSSQELQRQFLSWLSHELRTPLTAIRGYASSLMQPDVDWDGNSQRRFLKHISDESARLGRLVDDLFDFSAIDSGILRLQPDWCDLNLVLQAARDCLPASASSRVEIRCGGEFSEVWADHDRLEQVFVNLLDNAIRHNPPATTVRVDAVAVPPGTVQVVVADDGMGMAADTASGRYGGKNGPRRRTRGAGLGLSITRGIIDAHGGRFEIQTGEKGTACVVTLPVALGAPAADMSPEPAIATPLNISPDGSQGKAILH